MSRAQLEAAKHLASITGRPLSDFYKMPSEAHTQVIERTDVCSCGESWDSYGVCHGTHQENKQAEESTMEDTQQPLQEGSISHTNKVEVSKETEIVQTLLRPAVPTELLQKFGGEDIKGKILHPTRQMSRKEYLSEKKKFKTVEEFWTSPLLYVMFRAEGQLEASFPNWTTSIEKDIK